MVLCNQSISLFLTKLFTIMARQPLENLNIAALDLMPSPEEIHIRVPISEKAAQTVLDGRETIKRILDRKDPRLFIVVGPCSIHDVIAGLDYAKRLKRLADQVCDTLFLIMRVYFEKPRTSVGWKGFINDPRMDDSFHIEEGMEQARRLSLAGERAGPSGGDRGARSDCATIPGRSYFLDGDWRAHFRIADTSRNGFGSVDTGRF